jgi:ketosteroid isomerase-like protein
MSQENVGFVREVWKAYVDRGIDAASDYYADRCVIEDIQDLPDGRTYTGKKGLRERYVQFAEIWRDFSAEPPEFIDGGGNSVVVVARLTGRAPGSGLPLDAPLVFVYDVHDRRIVRDRAFASRGEALKAVGLEE